MIERIAPQLTLEFVKATEAAAVSCGRLVGTGDKEKCDGAAVYGMRSALKSVDVDGVIVIGEGELDEAPMLYIGEKVGSGKGVRVDIAVDPLEGTKVLANGLGSALSVLAVAEEGCFLHAPDMYMDKIAVGPKAAGKIDLDAPMEENLKNVARALGKDISDVTVGILNRPRNANLISHVRKAGSRIKLILDGDLSLVLAVAFGNSDVDVVAGIGGAPEGVLSAAALKCLGGEIQGRLWPTDEKQIERIVSMGLKDVGKKLVMDDFVENEDVVFAATGVTSGEILSGVRYKGPVVETHSLVTCGADKTVRFIKTRHALCRMKEFLAP